MNVDVGATNPGSIAQIVHRHKSKIEVPVQVRVQRTKRFEEPACSSKRLRPSQRSNISPRERPPLPDRQARQGAMPPKETDKQSAPVGTAGANGGKTT